MFDIHKKNRFAILTPQRQIAGFRIRPKRLVDFLPTVRTNIQSVLYDQFITFLSDLQGAHSFLSVVQLHSKIEIQI